MTFGYMQHDRPGFKQDEFTLLIGRDLPEGLKRKVRRLPHRLEGKKADIIGLAHFFERPADAHIAGETLAAIGRVFKGGNGDCHCCSPSLPVRKRPGMPSPDVASQYALG
ncbi:hypothetical protein D3C86_1850320 [compost metagenome]